LRHFPGITKPGLSRADLIGSEFREVQ